MGQSGDDLVFTGSLIDGPHIDLVGLAGIQLSDDEHDRLWDDTSPRDLLVDILDCEEIELYEIDDMPGRSDRFFEYRCGPREEFIEKLRKELAEIVFSKAFLRSAR
jgi:hypothetical protein